MNNVKNSSSEKGNLPAAETEQNMENKIDSKIESKVDSKIENKLDSNAANQLDSKVDSKSESKVDSKPENKKTRNKSVNQVLYSPLEEKINILTHFVGGCLSIVATVLMLMKLIADGSTDTLAYVAVSLFSLGLLSLYFMSALYHAQPVGKKRRVVFRKFDHCSIALLIAGTYAPLTLLGLGGALGLGITIFVSGMAILVIVFNSIDVHKFRVFSLIAYVLMGWACIFAFKSLIAAIGRDAFVWLLIGGAFYTLGIVFYRIKRIPYNHAIWHFFVLGGSISHFICIYVYII